MSAPGPWIEDLIVIRRRVRVRGDTTEFRMKLAASVDDPDLIIASLERARYMAMQDMYGVNESLAVTGLEEAE